MICDEFGYIPFSIEGAQLLFQFFSERYERGSVLVTKNLDFARWTQVFGDERMTAALLDRLTHREHVLLVEGESYRLRGGPPPDRARRLRRSRAQLLVGQSSRAVVRIPRVRAHRGDVGRGTGDAPSAPLAASGCNPPWESRRSIFR